MDHLNRRGLLEGLSSTLAACSLPVTNRQDGPAETFELERRFLTRVGAAVTVNGQANAVFIIDTGAAATSIADTLVTALELPAREPLLVHGTTGSEVRPSVEIESLALRGQTYENLRCPVFARSDIGADGLLGLDVLGRYRLSFDLMLRQARLEPRLTVAAEGVAHGPAGQLVVTQVSVNGQVATAFVDSGSQQTVGNTVLRSAMGLRGPLSTAQVTIRGISGEGVPTEAMTGARLQVGGARLNDVTLPFADLYCFEALGIDKQPAMLIGADVLSQFRWVSMDFARNSLKLEGRRRVSRRPA